MEQNLQPKLKISKNQPIHSFAIIIHSQTNTKKLNPKEKKKNLIDFYLPGMSFLGVGGDVA